MPDAKPLLISPATLPPRELLRAIRSKLTGTLLAWEGKDGLYLLDRRSGEQHFLAWEDVRARESGVE